MTIPVGADGDRGQKRRLVVPLHRNKNHITTLPNRYTLGHKALNALDWCCILISFYDILPHLAPLISKHTSFCKHKLTRHCVWNCYLFGRWSRKSSLSVLSSILYISLLKYGKIWIGITFNPIYKGSYENMDIRQSKIRCVTPLYNEYWCRGYKITPFRITFGQ